MDNSESYEFKCSQSNCESNREMDIPCTNCKVLKTKYLKTITIDSFNGVVVCRGTLICIKCQTLLHTHYREGELEVDKDTEQAFIIALRSFGPVIPTQQHIASGVVNKKCLQRHNFLLVSLIKDTNVDTGEKGECYVTECMNCNLTLDHAETFPFPTFIRESWPSRILYQLSLHQNISDEHLAELHAE